MPTYEYACAGCGNEWEEIQKISEPPVEECPKCREKKAKRQISGGNFILKGGGWYADLYSSSGNKSSKKEDGKGSSSSSESTSKESAPAAPASPSPSPSPGKDSGGSTSSKAA